MYEPEHFGPLANAVLQRRRVVLEHYSKRRNEAVRREVSPLRLTYYRENWYLDAYCHLRDDLRSFGLDAISAVELTQVVAREVEDSELAATLDAGYGIFSGRHVEWAELVFTADRARWVSRESWHPDQESWVDAQGNFHLRVPYSDPTELMMDIMKHLPEVSVVSPVSLRAAVMQKLTRALERI